MDEADPQATPQATPRDVDEAVGTAPDAGVDAGDGQGPHRIELLREALTMALYLSLSLLAVLVLLPDVIPDEDNRWQAAGTILVTALGLLLAHHVAYRLSSRLVDEGLLTPESILALKAQAFGGGLVALAAALPVLVFGEDWGEEVSELVLLAFVTWAGYRSARKRTTRLRSAIYVIILSGAVALVLLVKLAVGH